MKRFKKFLPKLPQKLTSKLLPVGIILTLFLLIFITYQSIFADKFFPGIFIGDTHLAFLTKDQASRVLNSKFKLRSQNNLQFSSPEGSYNISLATSSAEVNYDQALIKAFSVGHEQDLMQRLGSQTQVLLLKKEFGPDIIFLVDSQIITLATKVNQPSKDALLSFDDGIGTSSAKIQITPSENGLEVDAEELKQEIKNYLSFGFFDNQLPLKVTLPEVTTDEAQVAKKSLEEVEKEPVKLTFEQREWVLDVKTLLPLLDLKEEQQFISQKLLTDYIKNNVASQINQDVKEGQFNFDASTKKVTAFQPSQPGQALDIDKTLSFINLALSGQRAKTISLPVNIVQPKIKTNQVNDLGIKELIGRGVSNFAGSIPNRIYNVNLTATKINGVLIPPGETFSFNGTVGDITAATGFKQAYVIKGGRTVLDDGGGVCQDSTTLFRAVLNTGLPVVQRVAHSYRVGYYEQGFPPGLDATVFSPSVDFQFKNDTSAHILIQAYTEGSSLYVDLYGTSDGRTTTLTHPIITNQTPPPPELRQDDPTLPRGQVKQVDWAAWGANVSFKRTVTRGGEVIASEIWKSNYRPWQAVFLVGTKD